MTTDFDSFGESPAGAFTESPLGARNGERYQFNLAVRLESADFVYPWFQPGDGQGQYTHDLSYFANRQSRMNPPGTSALVYGGMKVEDQRQYVLPRGRSFPDFVPVAELTYDALAITGAMVIAAVETILLTHRPTSFGLFYRLGTNVDEAFNAFPRWTQDTWRISFHGRVSTPPLGAGWVGELGACIEV